MKLTPWFSGGQKPVRVGVYQRKYGESDHEPIYCYWDGLSWHIWHATAYEAYVNFNPLAPYRSPYQKELWRGLMK